MAIQESAAPAGGDGGWNQYSYTYDCMEPDVVAGVPDVTEDAAVAEVLQSHREELLQALITVQEIQEQQKVMKVAGKRAKVIDSNVAELGQEVREHRFSRLDRYARRYNWSPSHPPVNAMTSKKVMGWWREWVALQAEMGMRRKSPASDRVRIQTGIFEEAAQ